MRVDLATERRVSLSRLACACLTIVCVLATTVVARASATTPTPAPVVAVDHDAVAVEAYRKGDLATARTAWTDALAGTDGRERARILYDLGNVAFREGKTLEAVGWYTASLRLRPRDADTWNNLEEARSRAKLDPADRGDLSGTLRRLLRSFTGTEGRWLALAGLATLAAALAYEALRGGRLARVLAWTAAGVALLACAPWIDSLAHRSTIPLLVIQPEGTSVRSEPRDKGAVTAELPPGAVVEHVDELPEWTKVRLDTGLEGWARKAHVFALKR